MTEEDMLNELRDIFTSPAPPYAKTAAELAEALGVDANTLAQRMISLCEEGTWARWRASRNLPYLYWKIEE